MAQFGLGISLISVEGNYLSRVLQILLLYHTSFAQPAHGTLVAESDRAFLQSGNILEHCA